MKTDFLNHHFNSNFHRRLAATKDHGYNIFLTDILKSCNDKNNIHGFPFNIGEL